MLVGCSHYNARSLDHSEALWVQIHYNLNFLAVVQKNFRSPNPCFAQSGRHELGLF